MTSRFRAVGAYRVDRDVRKSVSGLVLPGIDSTAPMLGLTQVPTENAWLHKLARVYPIARAYLAPFDGRGAACSTGTSGSACRSRSTRSRSTCVSLLSAAQHPWS